MTPDPVPAGPLPRADLPAQAARRLRHQILSGQLAPGDTLPAERELAVAFGINRATVREALGQLERAGLLTRRQGSLAVVSDFRRTGTLDLLPDLIDAAAPGSPARAAAETSARELVRALYTEAARLAAGRRTAPDLMALRAAVHNMTTGIDTADQQRFRSAQQDFQAAVMTATQSVAFELAGNTITQATAAASVPGDQPPAASTPPGPLILAFYRTLLHAIEGRHTRQAAELVRAALTTRSHD